jgi:hypothetical protein
MFRLGGFDLLLDGRDLFLGLGNGGLNVLKRELQLIRVELLGLRPELRPAVLLDRKRRLRLIEFRVAT